MKQQIQSCQFDGRNYGIDIMKILSAFMVVFYHFGHRKYEFFEACNYVPNINYRDYEEKSVNMIFYDKNGR